MTKLWIAGICGLLIVNGCAEFNSIQASFEGDRDRVATIDAKQRVISINPDGKGGIEVCVEQSPDAFSVFSGSASLSAEAQAEFAAALAAAYSESGSSLAFRTQVTQAQTNLLYTLCQLRSNGALSNQAVRAEIRRFQHTVLGLLAIEQLTSPYRQSPAQQILTTSNASAGQEVDARQQEVADKQEAVKTKEGELKAAEKAVADAGDNATGEQRTAVETKKAELASAEKDLEIAREKLRAARLAVTATAGGQLGTINVFAPPENGTISKEVAQAVVQSLDIVLTRGVLVDSCVEAVLEQGREPLPASTAGTTLQQDLVNSECLKVFATYVAAYAANEASRNELTNARADFVRQIGITLVRLAEQGKLTTEIAQAIAVMVRDAGAPQPDNPLGIHPGGGFNVLDFSAED